MLRLSRALIFFISGSFVFINSIFAENLEFKTISTRDLKILLVESKIILIDIRPSVFYQMGHIKGAVNIPLIDFNETYIPFSETKEAKEALEIIVYCSDSNCNDSLTFAKKIKSQGKNNVLIYKEGWKGWMHSKI